jgi:succinate dehydrogenase / fumarate reductase membrane anchor subunit
VVHVEHQVKRYTKNPVGAHYGLGDWLLQRLTAVVMAGYTAFVVLALVTHRPLNYPAWKSIFSEMWFQVGTMLFVAALLYHAWVGMRDILMDYVHSTALRLTAQFAVAFVLLFYLVWTAAILWGR